MKKMKKLRLIPIIFLMIVLASGCSKEDRNVKECRKMSEKFFQEFKNGEIQKAMDTYYPYSDKQDITNGMGYFTSLLGEETDTYKNLMKEALKDSKINFDTYEYDEENQMMTLYYTYTGKGLDQIYSILLDEIVSTSGEENDSSIFSFNNTSSYDGKDQGEQIDDLENIETSLPMTFIYKEGYGWTGY